MEGVCSRGAYFRELTVLISPQATGYESKSACVNRNGHVTNILVVMAEQLPEKHYGLDYACTRFMSFVVTL